MKAAFIFILVFLISSSFLDACASRPTTYSQKQRPSKLESEVRKPGIDYPVETEEFVVNEEKLRPMTLQIFGPLMK